MAPKLYYKCQSPTIIQSLIISLHAGRWLYKHIFWAILKTNIECNVIPIPGVVAILMVKSGFLTSGAMLTLQDCDLSMRGVRGDVHLGELRRRVLADTEFVPLIAKGGIVL